jgi:hypothetical protein
MQRLLENVEREVALERARYPPTDENTSMTNATYTNPA